MVAGAELKRDVIAAGIDRGYLDATTLMEYLISVGVPQRTAHELIGKLVATAMKQNCRLADLTVEEFQAAHQLLDERVFEVLGVERAVAAFKSTGSTNPKLVAEQVEIWKTKLAN